MESKGRARGIDDVLQFVDLSVAKSPVLPDDARWPVRCSEAENDTFYLWEYASGWYGSTDGRHTYNVPREQIRKWRARYLVMRDEIFRTVVTQDYRNLPDLMQWSVISRVLPAFGIYWTPTGELREAMKKHYQEQEHYVQADGSILQGWLK